MKIKLSARYDVEPVAASGASNVTMAHGLKRHGADLLLPTRRLAEAIASEWRAQEKTIKPETMPITQLSMTTLDITSQDSPRIVDELVGYVDTEMACHRAEEPDALVQHQQEAWQPLLDGLAKDTGATLITGTGIMGVQQSAETHKILRQKIETLDAWHLTGLRHATDLCGSLVVGWAIAQQRLDLDAAVTAAELEANFQMEKWGEDPIQTKRREVLHKDLTIALLWFDLLKP